MLWMCELKVFTKRKINTKWELEDPRHDLCSVECATRKLRMHAWGRVCTLALPHMSSRSTLACFLASLGASGHGHKSSCDDRALRQQTLQPFKERRHNPNQAVVLMCVGQSPDYSPPCLSLFGTEKCVEKGMDKWMERERARERGCSLEVFSLFGEFADDTDQCSIFIFKTLVVCSQVNQYLEVKIQHNLQKKTKQKHHFL